MNQKTYLLILLISIFCLSSQADIPEFESLIQTTDFSEQNYKQKIEQKISSEQIDLMDNSDYIFQTIIDTNLNYEIKGSSFLAGDQLEQQNFILEKNQAEPVITSLFTKQDIEQSEKSDEENYTLIYELEGLMDGEQPTENDKIQSVVQIAENSSEFQEYKMISPTLFNKSTQLYLGFNAYYNQQAFNKIIDINQHKYIVYQFKYDDVCEQINDQTVCPTVILQSQQEFYMSYSTKEFTTISSEELNKNYKKQQYFVLDYAVTNEDEPNFYFSVYMPVVNDTTNYSILVGASAPKVENYGLQSAKEKQTGFSQNYDSFDFFETYQFDINSSNIPKNQQLQINIDSDQQILYTVGSNKIDHTLYLRSRQISQLFNVLEERLTINIVKLPLINSQATIHLSPVKPDSNQLKPDVLNSIDFLYTDYNPGYSYFYLDYTEQQEEEANDKNLSQYLQFESLDKISKAEFQEIITTKIKVSTQITLFTELTMSYPTDDSELETICEAKGIQDSHVLYPDGSKKPNYICQYKLPFQGAGTQLIRLQLVDGATKFDLEDKLHMGFVLRDFSDIKNDDDDGLSGGAIAGIVIGSVIGVLIIAGLIYYFYYRKKQIIESVEYEEQDDIEYQQQDE